MTDVQEKPATTTILELRTETLPAVPFRWRDRHAVRHPITGMETRHLFYTVRMIWNHSMPPVARSTSYKRYTFGPEYTPVYLAQAIKAMLPEILGRGDLQPDWRAEIDRWVVFLGYMDRNGQNLLHPAGDGQ